jgi:putative flippase GtrA
MSLYGTLRHLLELESWYALGLSFGAGILTNFGLSRNWAFGAKAEKWYWQFGRFLGVISLIYIVSGWITQGLYAVWPIMPGRSFWVRGASAIGTLPLSYALHKWVSFRQAPAIFQKSLPLERG